MEVHNYQPRSLLKALSILGCFDARHPELTAHELSRQLGLGQSSLYRYLAALEAEGYLERVEGNRYALGLRVIELGGLALGRLVVRRHGQEVLERLADAVNMNANLAVLHDGDVFHLAYAIRNEVDYLYTVVGRRSPAHTTALGKSLLAHQNWSKTKSDINTFGWRVRSPSAIRDFPRLRAELERVKDDGYAIDRGEGKVQTWCVAAPVWAQREGVVAAISVSGPPERFGPQALPSIISEVTTHAEVLSLRLGHSDHVH